MIVLKKNYLQTIDVFSFPVSAILIVKICSLVAAEQSKRQILSFVVAALFVSILYIYSRIIFLGSKLKVYHQRCAQYTETICNQKKDYQILLNEFDKTKVAHRPSGNYIGM